MKNVIIKRTIKLQLTAEQWQLYTSSMDCRMAARTINSKVARIINAASDKDQAYRNACEVLNLYSDFGASDSEPRYVLRKVLAEFFGDY